MRARFWALSSLAICSMRSSRGFTIIPRVQVAHMAQTQNMFHFPPAPKLDAQGRLDATQATERERRGAEIFFGKGQCVGCHPPPTYLDHQMHDLKVERFVNEAPLGPMKTFTLRGIKDSPPYPHDGRCLTLEDTIEFLNLVLGLQLSAEEKQDLAAFVKVL